MFIVFFNCRKNISYASTCNGAGLSLGVLCGYIIPITLISESFCNKWLRVSPLPGGILTFKGKYIVLRLQAKEIT